MRQQVKHMAKIYNATFEKLVVCIYSRYWTFEPRSYTEVDEFYLEPIEREHASKGLVPIYPDEDFSEKEKQALMAYRSRLVERIQNYQSEMDEAKKRGSVMEEQIGHKLAKKWLDQIDKRYAIQAQLMQEEHSFLDLDKPKKSKKVEEQVAV